MSLFFHPREPSAICIPACALGALPFAAILAVPVLWNPRLAPFTSGIYNREINLKSFLSNPTCTFLSALLLGAALLFILPACSPKSSTTLPVLSDPSAGLTLTLPATATAHKRSPAFDRFVSRIPYAPNQTLLYLHAYCPPLVDPTAIPDFHDDIVEAILREELTSFVSLGESYTNLTDQTPVLLLFGRARDTDKVIGFAFQCNKTHFIFLGLCGPDLVVADTKAFFETTAPNLHIADIRQSTHADVTRYRTGLVTLDNPAQSIDFIRNLFASRNTSPLNYTIGINLAYSLAQDLQANAPDSPHLSEAIALLNIMTAIHLADTLKARHDFEVALGQRNVSEAIAQARFLTDLTFLFDAEGQSRARQRLRKAQALH